MADFRKPANDDLYTAVLGDIRDLHVALARQNFDAVANVPDGAIRFNPDNSRWEIVTAGIWKPLKPLTEIFQMKVLNSDQLNGQTADYYNNASNITRGTLAPNRLGGLNASKIIAGIFSALRIPNLSATKIASGVLNILRIPGLPASKITSGTFSSSRIPGLSASKITSGTFSSSRIPSLSASKITSGTLTRPWRPSGSQPLSKITVSPSGPSGTRDGELWLEY